MLNRISITDVRLPPYVDNYQVEWTLHLDGETKVTKESPLNDALIQELVSLAERNSISIYPTPIWCCAEAWAPSLLLRAAIRSQTRSIAIHNAMEDGYLKHAEIRKDWKRYNHERVRKVFRVLQKTCPLSPRHLTHWLYGHRGGVDSVLWNAGYVQDISMMQEMVTEYQKRYDAVMKGRYLAQQIRENMLYQADDLGAVL